MMESIYYQKGAHRVTPRLFKTARKTYRISDIEKINIRRPVFWGTLPLAIACYYLREIYGQYLYEHELWGCIAMFTAVPVIAWFIGTLTITSKSLTNDTAVTGFMPSLRTLREAIERAIYLPDPSSHSKGDRHYTDLVDD